MFLNLGNQLFGWKEYDYRNKTKLKSNEWKLRDKIGSFCLNLTDFHY